MDTLEVFPRIRTLGTVDVHDSPIAALDLIREIKRLLEVIESIDEDKRRSRRCDLRKHVRGCETSEAKRRGLEEVGEVSDGPCEDRLGRLGAELGVDGIELGLAQRQVKSGKCHFV